MKDQKVTLKKSEQPVEWIAADSLSVDPRLQREFKPRWVEERKDAFDPNAFSVLTVSERANGTYVILDGQHRMALLRTQSFFDNQQLVPCAVKRGLSFPEEARLFLELNDRVRVGAFDAFRQRLNSKEPDAIAINEIVKSLGFKLSRSTTEGEGEISAVISLDRVYCGFRPKHPNRFPDALASAISIIAGAFGRGSKNFQGDLITGIGAFVLRYGNEVDHQSLINKMAKEYGKDGAYQLIGQGRASKQIHQSNITQNIANVLVNLYNRSRRVGQIEKWWK